MSRSVSRGRKETPATIAGPRLLFILVTIALLCIGLVMVYSASSVKAISETGNAAKFLLNQVAYIGVGVVFAAVVYFFIPCRAWRSTRFVWFVWLVAIALLVATAVVGTDMNGAKRWLKFSASVGIQPSEFAKIAFVVVAARLFYDFREGKRGLAATVGLFAGLIALPLILFVYKLQSDLGTTLICVVGIFAVLWLGEVPLRIVLLAVAVGVVLVSFAIFGTDYRSGRMVFLNPWDDGKGGYGDGYNLIRSLYAFSDGGLFGVGLGNSREKYLYLFASESDFIFAIIGDELGFVGALLVIGLFLLFLFAGVRVAQNAADSFGMYLAGACTTMIVFQAFLNMGCAMGVLPTTGKPLPFISAGGSSMIATLIMVGLILSVSREVASANVYEDRRANLRVVRANRGAGDASGRPGRGRGEVAPVSTRRGGGVSSRSLTRAAASDSVNGAGSGSRYETRSSSGRR